MYSKLVWKWRWKMATFRISAFHSMYGNIGITCCHQLFCWTCRHRRPLAQLPPPPIWPSLHFWIVVRVDPPDIRWIGPLIIVCTIKNQLFGYENNEYLNDYISCLKSLITMNHTSIFDTEFEQSVACLKNVAFYSVVYKLAICNNVLYCLTFGQCSSVFFNVHSLCCHFYNRSGI